MASIPERIKMIPINDKPVTGVAKQVGTPSPIMQKLHLPITKPVFGPPNNGPAVIEAELQIAAKTKQLGGLPGSAVGSIRVAGNGFVQQYQGCDIYYSPSTGAREVHGDIRVKYNDLGGASGELGLPTTDETGTPDGIGRFNHFVGGSIYWTPNTGPMMVRGAIRDLWASQGWERGTLKYPVEDEHRMVPSSPNTQPATYWSLFENGAILSSSDGTAEALAAEIPPDALRTLIRSQFDQQIHQSPDNVGLQAQIDTLSISDWSYGFWKSGGRKITYRLYGFHDNGLAPDTNFTADVELGFDLVWPDQFGEPGTKTLVVGLFSASVTATGLGSSAVSNGVASGIHDGFYPKNGPDPNTPYIPSGWKKVTDISTGAQADGSNIDVIGILITPTGSLQILVNPVPTASGNLRKLFAQRTINKYIEDNT